MSLNPLLKPAYLKTPDHLCAVSTPELAQQGQVQDMVPLAQVYNRIKRNFENHFTKTCFDPKVIEFFAAQGQMVVAENGKFLNCI